MKKIAKTVGLGAMFLLAGSASAQVETPPQVVMRRTTVKPGDIPPGERASVALRVAAIAIENGNIQLRIGDTLSLDSVLVVAIDSAGTRIGRLRVFDSTLKPDHVVDPAGLRRYVAVTEGITTIVCRYPLVYWKDRTDPQVEVSLTVVVKP